MQVITIVQQSIIWIKIISTCLCKRKLESCFSKEEKKFVYQDGHMSPEYIFHNQYPINCPFKCISSF